MPDENVVQPTDDAAARQLDAAMSRFEGDFIESADLMQTPGGVTLTIAGIVPPNAEKDASGKPINKPIVAFERTAKRMVLGRTNERILRAWHGRKASGWIGKQIRIGVRYLASAFGQSNVPTLRILLPPELPAPFNVRKYMGSEYPFSS